MNFKLNALTKFSAIFRPIEMENLQNDDQFNNNQTESNVLLPQAPQAYVSIAQPTPPTDRVTYAQIIRPVKPNDAEQFDFRLQQPQQTSNDNFVPITSGRSSISDVSSGYIDLTQNLARPVVKRNVRPTSPETSF
jgi:hypothetical protein